MAMKKHHKIILGSFTSIVILFMIISGILLNTILTTQNLNYNSLNNKITNLQADTQNKLNELTINLIQIKTALENELESLGGQIGTIDQEFDLLRASAGEDFSGIIEDAVKSVVTIRTDVGQGTGFIISDEGYIVTNAHVLLEGKLINSITYEQKTIPTEFIGYDGKMDLALLKISGNYKKLDIENSENIQIGEKVIAIGNPLGLQFSVSQGIVSGIHRTGSNGLNAYIQTDAALNPGNSGGPLINQKGKVIGINNFKIGDGESLGFALESNYIKETINEISQEKLNQTLI